MVGWHGREVSPFLRRWDRGGRKIPLPALLVRVKEMIARPRGLEARIDVCWPDVVDPHVRKRIRLHARRSETWRDGITQGIKREHEVVSVTGSFAAGRQTRGTWPREANARFWSVPFALTHRRGGRISNYG